MNKQKETKKGEQTFNKQFLNRLARITKLNNILVLVAWLFQGNNGV
jgi:hypothetical protein